MVLKRSFVSDTREAPAHSLSGCRGDKAHQDNMVGLEDGLGTCGIMISNNDTQYKGPLTAVHFGPLFCLSLLLIVIPHVLRQCQWPLAILN